MGSLGVTWADIGCPLGVVGGLRGGLGRLGGAMGGLKFENTHICNAKSRPWDQVKGCREAPGMHQGCTVDAPRMQRVGSMGGL